MLETERVAAIFADAWELYGDAIEEVERRKLRIAAEVAWGATKRATDALILAHTGREPMVSTHTSRGLRFLRKQDPALESFRVEYNHRQSMLHGKYFYRGDCGSEVIVTEIVRATANFIRDAENFAGHAI